MYKWLHENLNCIEDEDSFISYAMGSLQTYLLSKAVTDDINESIVPSVFDKSKIAVRVNDDKWLKIKLLIKCIKGDETTEECLHKNDSDKWKPV